MTQKQDRNLVVENKMRQIERAKGKESFGKVRDKILARMITFPYQSLPRRSQMWLWNRWLGQPTKRVADKNISHKHTCQLAQSLWQTHKTLTCSVTEKHGGCLAFSTSPSSLDLWFSTTLLYGTQHIMCTNVFPSASPAPLYTPLFPSMANM